MVYLFLNSKFFNILSIFSLAILKKNVEVLSCHCHRCLRGHRANSLTLVSVITEDIYLKLRLCSC